MKSFEELVVWQEGREYRKKISKLVKGFPAEEKYKLTDQLLRSSRSVTANIAEGYGRYHYKENAQFCRQARGSLKETLDHLICAFDEEYISKETLQEYRDVFENVLKLLNGYINYLNNAKVQNHSGYDKTPVANNSITK